MKQRKAAPVGLMKFIPKVSPRFREPSHLEPLVEALERTEREPVHAVGNVPPRHMKTETYKHGIARRLLIRPHTRIAYVTHAAAAATKRSREIRQLYVRAGGTVIEDANTLADWRTTDTGTDDGGLWATSVGGQITGEGFDLIIIDDPIKSRAVAESGVEREKLIDWYRDTLSTREEPGASTIYLGARWTPGDLAGHLLREGWESINLPALSATGEALCPSRYDLAALHRIRETLGEYGWQALYQGAPYARGGRVYGDPSIYGAPPEAMRIGIGVDFAYSKKTRADYSVAVVLGEAAGFIYVLEVARLQVTAPEFKTVLDELTQRYRVRPMAYIGGTERGVIDLLNQQLAFPIWSMPALADKFVRAQPSSAAWNAGKILVPREAKWLDAFVSELVNFTGNDVHDDQVDALAGAFEALRQTAISQVLAARARERWKWTQAQLEYSEGYPEKLEALQRDQIREATLATIGNPEWVARAAAEPMRSYRLPWPKPPPPKDPFGF